MNPLKEKQVKQLEALNCADLARKVDELVKYINEQCFFGKEMTVNVCNGKEKTVKQWTGAYSVCDCPEPCQLHKEECDCQCHKLNYDSPKNTHCQICEHEVESNMCEAHCRKCGERMEMKIIFK